MSDIITRLEAAEVGSRELDMDIWRRVDLKGYEDRASFVMALEYTTSIDAALSLVPEVWAWHLVHVGKLTQDDGTELDFRPRASLWIPSLRTQGLAVESADGEAPTPALALCIAALKARGQDNG